MFLSTLYGISLWQERRAKINESKAFKQSARVNLTSKQALDAMIDSLKSGIALKHWLVTLFQPSRPIKEQVTGTLQWSVYQVKELNQMQGDTVPARSTFNPQGNLLASAEENGMIRLWNLQGEELAAFQADPKRVWAVAFSPIPFGKSPIPPSPPLIRGVGGIIASAGENGKISLWNLQGEQLASWQAHQGQVRDISFSSNGKIIATAGGEDSTVKLWNVQGKLLKSWQAHKGMLKSVSFSPIPLGAIIATAGQDKTIRIWNLKGYLLQEFPVHAWKVVFSPDGKYIASAGDDGRIHLWNRKYQQLGSWQADNQRIWNVTFSPDSKFIASSGEDGSARVWNLQGKQILEFNGHNGPARSVSFSQDVKVLASAGDDGITRLWNLEDRQLAKWQGDNNSVHGVVFSQIPPTTLTKEGKEEIIVSGGDDGIVRLWNIKGEKLLQLPPHNASVKSISISSNGNWLASGDEDGIINLWNFQKKSLQQILACFCSCQSQVLTVPSLLALANSLPSGLKLRL